MDEKHCCTCHLMRPVSEYNKRAAARDGLQSRCRACSATWYQANKKAHTSNVRVRNNRVRAENELLLMEYLLAHACVDCGETDVRVLEFDHEDPSQKRGGVTRLVASSMSWDCIQDEIDKCSVRCANCHRRRTADMFGFRRATVEQERRAVLTAQAQTRLTAILAPRQPPK